MNLQEAAARAPFDLLVIGGGINGAAVAREAAIRGLRVALFEQDDFGFGTTWRSTRLIHGGLRYLEHGEVGLVFESLRERGRLLRERPHLVKPQPFVLPGGRFSRRPSWQMRIGLAAYDLLATGGSLPRHQSLTSAEVQHAVPGLGQKAPGGFSFYDARAVAPERIALELALEARNHGALIANHASVTTIGHTDGLVTGVTVVHRGEEFEFRGDHVINAAGPWVDAVNNTTGARLPRILGTTRGTHIAIELPAPLPDAAVLATARSDGRVFFALPHSGLLLVGTTDVRDEGDPGFVSPTRREAEYLLGEAQSLLPDYGITADMVRYAYAGLRPLLASSRGPESAITRKHAVVDHSLAGGPAGLYSVAGGKLSTYQPLAREALRAIGIHWGSNRATRPPARLAAGPGLEGRVLDHIDRYGHAAPAILGNAGRVICEHAGAVTAEISHAVRSELAASLSDVLMRRTGIAWHACRGLCCHREAAEIMASLLGWDASETAQQIAAYERDVAHHLPEWSDLSD
ncbi:MAG: glycerol-3-phosphate dehydrogenase/oxidase [Dehalococcoidia bacterium]|nr:glycerol-3-phosphate dehydrogenase/oxidase [Dehalococcoidia bacterium]